MSRLFNGAFLRELRGSEHQGTIGEAVGLSRSSIGSYELGKAQPSIATIDALSDFFGVASSRFWTENGSGVDPEPKQTTPPQLPLELEVPEAWFRPRELGDIDPITFLEHFAFSCRSVIDRIAKQDQTIFDLGETVSDLQSRLDRAESELREANKPAPPPPPIRYETPISELEPPKPGEKSTYLIATDLRLHHGESHTPWQTVIEQACRLFGFEADGLMIERKLPRSSGGFRPGWVLSLEGQAKFKTTVESEIFKEDFTVYDHEGKRMRFHYALDCPKCREIIQGKGKGKVR